MSSLGHGTPVITTPCVLSTGARGAAEAPSNASAHSSNTAAQPLPPNTALSGDGHFWRVMKPPRDTGWDNSAPTSVGLLAPELRLLPQTDT